MESEKGTKICSENNEVQPIPFSRQIEASGYLMEVMSRLMLSCLMDIFSVSQSILCVSMHAIKE